MEYKWFFDESGVLTECEPRVDGDTKLEYAPETNEVFYRAKLNGTLSFRLEFDDILAKGFGHTHVVVLQRYNENQFVEVWRGKFTLTDCTINYETHTIEVQPATIDRYTDVLAALEKEYNITKLPIKQESVNILIRPCLQIYSLNDAKLTNCVGYNSWEINCDAVGGSDIANYHFIERAEYFAICIQYNNYKSEVAGQRIIYWGIPDWNSGEFYLTGKRWNGTQYVDHTLFCECGNTYEQTHTYFRVYYPNGGGGYESGYFVRADFDFLEAGTTAVVYYSEYAPYTSDATAQWNKVYCRLIAQTELSSITIHQSTYQLYDLTNTDMAGANMNYNKVMEADFIDAVVDGRESAEPTAWGLNYNEKYFEKPADVLLRHYAPAGQDLWKYVSIWWYIDSPSSYNIANDELTATRRIKDCYDYRQTIAKLLNKAGVYPDYLISGCLGGTNDYVGARTNLLFTPRSNVISSYYDTPAQNAPISLSKILNMLKAVYKCYWHIDSNGNFHIEHISYYQNGYSYTELPQQLVDLENEMHTRTKHAKAYGQNVVKFAINEMCEQFTFGWADQQTRPFDGFPIDCLDAYVQKGSISEQFTGDFDSDVDYVLASPNDVSKDGFFLFALPATGADYATTLQVETVRITDELGDTYNVMIQNADAAYVKIHKTWWRYDMPCENLQINNETDTAITTGRFKTQTLEFADVSMADVIDNVDNCIKLIKTQQGNGGIAKLAINLNSLATTADLVFTLFGRKYYLKGAALNGTLTITLNGEQITINVENNRFVYGYTEPINELKFANTDVVSVDFADCDTMAELTSADDMFKNCAELVAVDFANKTFGAVTTANDMFAGCANLVDLICPATESWKPDLDFSDCPNLTLQSLNDLIVKFLYQYDSGVHTITPNSTMWNALAPEEQTDIMAKATAKGWQIGIPAQYAIVGTSNANTVYATINGNPVEIPVLAGAFRYEYNNPITAISFENDANVTLIDFTESDLLAGVTSLNNAFKGCASLVAVDFHDCDLSNVATAVDCFSGCVALTTFDADSGVWKPDVDFSDCALLDYYDMQTIVGILYTYATGTHTITFNQTYWDTLTQAQQQTISDAAGLKYWTTNAVVIIYHIRGVTNVLNGTVHFNVQFIADGVPSVESFITCETDAQGAFDYTYSNKKIYSLAHFNYQISGSPFLISVDFSDADDLSECISLYRAFTYQYIGTILDSVSFRGKKLNAVLDASYMFNTDTLITQIDMSDAEFNAVTDITQAFFQCPKLTIIDLPKATFASVSAAQYAFANTNAGGNSDTTTTINMPNATFANVADMTGILRDKRILATLNMQNALCGKLATTTNMFQRVNSLTNFNLLQQSTAILPTSSAANAPMDLHTAPLSYQSMLNVANWLSDLTGQTAHTCTFRTSAWNALSSAEQNTIDTILSGKNWTRAIA